MSTEKKLVGYVDITPTWEGMLPAFVAVYTGGEKAEHRNEAFAELQRMARAADEAAKLRRSLWLLVEAAGGKASVPRSLQEDFDAKRARLHFGRDPDSGTLDFWTERA